MPEPAKTALPTRWPRHVRSATLHALSMAHVVATAARARAEHHFSECVRLHARIEALEERMAFLEEERRIKDARMERIDPRHRPHYPPSERLAILELRAACGWSQEEAARRFHITPLTLHNWMHRLDDEGPDALIQVPEPVNRFPDFVAYVVRRLKALCPRMGDRRIAQLLARASLHLGGTTVRRMLKPPAKRPSKRKPPAAERVVTAKRPNHLWHVDLTLVPTAGGFWVSWCPFPIAQRWPFCWWVAVVVDHFSRRALGTATFKQEPTAADVEKALDGIRKKVGARPPHMITDQGRQFTCTRLLPIVPRVQRAFAREIDDYLTWYNAERPHTRLNGRTPDEVYLGRFPACRKPRFEPRARWPKRSRCAGVQAPIRGKPGAELELIVTYPSGRKHLPVVTLRRVA